MIFVAICFIAEYNCNLQFKRVILVIAGQVTFCRRMNNRNEYLHDQIAGDSPLVNKGGTKSVFFPLSCISQLLVISREESSGALSF
jgi:hypothetical protein